MYTNMSLVKKKHKGNNSIRAGKKNRWFIFALHLCSSWGAEFEYFFCLLLEFLMRHVLF